MPYGQQKTFRSNVHNAAVQLQSLRSVFIRFNELLCKAGSEHNRSRFIVKTHLRRRVRRRQTRPFESAVYCPAERLLFPISKAGE